MLRCRRCRKSLIDSAFLTTVQGEEESSAAVCSIWHVNVDTLPEWIQTSITQAQWTMGKLNCHHCGARLGGFNFINRSECPCGRDATVHLSKSRVDHEQKHHVLIVQPRRARPERAGVGLLADGPQNEERGPHSAFTSQISPAETSGLLAACDNSPSFTFSPLYCISQKRRRSMEDEDSFGSSSCFCPAAPPDTSGADWMRSGTAVPPRSTASLPMSQQLHEDSGASFDIVPGHSAFSGGARSALEPLQAEEAEADSAEEATEELSDMAMFLRGRSISDSVAEQPSSALSAPVGSPASSGLSKREKSRLKSLRRKQRRRERWLHSQLELAGNVSASLTNGGGEDEEEEGRDGLTCAVCLDVYFSPYSCQPCGHVFCEPCLRTLAKNRPTNTPCPLCRTLISHTSFHNELSNTVKSFFPKVHASRKQNFQSAACAKWPLPSCCQRFRPFWGLQRRGATAGRHWHIVHGGFTLEALDPANMRGWLFDTGLVIICIHSSNKILAFILLCFLFNYFFL